MINKIISYDTSIIKNELFTRIKKIVEENYIKTNQYWEFIDIDNSNNKEELVQNLSNILNIFIRLYYEKWRCMVS